MELNKYLNSKEENHLKIIACLLVKECETDDILKNKVFTCDKTLEDAYVYVEKKAKEKAKGKSSICISDNEVMKWVIHFILENGNVSDVKNYVERADEKTIIKEYQEYVKKCTNERKAEEKKNKKLEKLEKQKQLYGTDIFSLLNGDDDA